MANLHVKALKSNWWTRQLIRFFIFLQERTKEYNNWKDAEPEVKFKRFEKAPDSIYIGMQLFDSDPPQYIGFDGSGKALQPSEVDVSKSDAFFVLKPVQ